MRRAEYSTRACPVCEDGSPRPVGTRERLMPGREDDHLLVLHDVVCTGCGVVYEWKVPDADFLEGMYADAHSLASDQEISLDYDPKLRLDLLGHHVSPGARVFEYGSGDGAFCEVLRNAGYDAAGTDPLDPGASPVGPFDAVVAYFVLEHLPDPRGWLAEVGSLLRPGGTVIIEVPDFTTEPVVSLGDGGHLTHFTPHHLGRLLIDAGMTLVACGLPASRYFGFAAVARSSAPDSAPIYVAARAAMDREEERRNDLAARLIGTASSFVLWGANEYAEGIAIALRRIRADVNIDVVDNASTKIGMMSIAGIEVSKPDLSSDGDRLFVVCSPTWNAEITAQIRAALPGATIVSGV